MTNLFEAMAWRVMAELMRRHSQHYELTRMHPNGGQSDYLTLLEESEPRLLLGPGHTLLLWPAEGENTMIPASQIWPSSSPETPFDLRNVVDLGSRLLQKHVPNPLPKSNRRVLTNRVMAAASARVAFEQDRYVWENGYMDPSGLGGGHQQSWFDRFPDALSDSPKAKVDLRGYGKLDRSFWFWLRQGEPQICLRIDGMCYGPAGWKSDLMHHYRQGGRVSEALYQGLKPSLL